MPEFLISSLSPGPALSWVHVGVRLLAALVLGRVVTLIYNRTRTANERTPSFPVTLVLLSVLIAMVTQVIGDNVARAFSLVGALSIVRFRTVVRDTEDTAFVIFAVVVGMAAGGNNLPVALTGIVVAAIAAFWMRDRAPVSVSSAPYVLRVRAGLGRNLDALIGPVLEMHTTDRKLTSIGTAKQGLSLEASYHVRLRAAASASELVKEINRIDGVQSVELVMAGEPDEPI
jgi:hypothetical protein